MVQKKGISVFATTFININKRNGLASDKINTIFGYGDNVVIGTKDGLSIIDTNTLSILSYNLKYDSLSIDSFLFNGLLFCISRDKVFSILLLIMEPFHLIKYLIPKVSPFMHL